MSDDDYGERKSLHDNGRVWGWMCEGKFRPIPKVPMINNELGPPPFEVMLASGELRFVINDPSGARDD